MDFDDIILLICYEFDDKQINCQSKYTKKTVQPWAAKQNVKMIKKDLLVTCSVRQTKNRKANIVHNERALRQAGH